MKLFVNDKSFYKLLFSLSLPVSLQNLITFGVSMLDTVMLGKLGDATISGAAMANQFVFVFMVLTFGLAGGTNVLLAQYWGKGDVESIKRAMSIMYKIIFGISVIFTLSAYFFPAQIMSVFSPDPAVISEGAKYLKIVSVTMLFFGLSSSSVMALRSVGTVNISLVMYTNTLVCNGVLNYILIFGKLGFAAMGIEGAAIATTISRGIELIILYIYMARFENKIMFRHNNLFKFNPKLIFHYLKTVMPVMFNEFLWSTGAAVLAIIIGWMGTEFITANSITSVVNQFVTVFIFGVGNAAAVIIGNTIGEGKKQLAHERSVTLLVISVLLGLVSGVLLYVLRPFAMQFYDVSPLAKEIAYQIMTVASFVVVFQSLAIISMMGVLRGGGDAHFVLVADVGFLWLFSLPFGAFAGLKLHWAIPVVYLILRSDEMLKCIFSVTRVINGKWIKDVTINKADNSN